MSKSKGKVPSKTQCFTKVVSKIKAGAYSKETLKAFTEMEVAFKKVMDGKTLTIAEQRVLGADIVLKHFSQVHTNLNNLKASLNVKKDEINVDYNVDDVIAQITDELKQIETNDIQDFSSPKIENNGNSKSIGNEKADQAEQQVPIETRNQNDRGQDRGQQAEGQVLELTPLQREGIVKSLLAKVREYNKTPASSTKKLSNLNGSISSLASKIGAKIEYGDIVKKKRKMLALDSDGKQLREQRVAVTQEVLDNQKQLTDRSPEFEEFFNKILPDIQLGLDKSKEIGLAKIDLDMPTDFIRSGLNAIKKGKYNQNAFDLLDKLQTFYDAGIVPFVERIGQNIQRTGIPIEYYTAVPEEAQNAIDQNEEDIDGMGINDDIALLTPDELFNVPIWWSQELDDQLTEMLGDAWSDEDFIKHQEDQAMIEMFDSALPEAVVENLVETIQEKLNEVENESIQPSEQPQEEPTGQQQQSDAVLPEDKPISAGNKKDNPKKPVKSRNPKVGVKFQLSKNERDQLVQDVFSNFNGVIDPDAIRQHLAPYGYNGANSNLFNYDMDHILSDVYDLALDMHANQGKSISFIIGSPGAGKSGVTKKATGDIVWDGVFTSSQKLSNFVQRAIEKGITPEVSMVFNFAINSYGNIIARYQRDTENGIDRRIVPLVYFINAVNAQSSRAADLRTEFGEQIKVSVLNNEENDNKHVLLTEEEESKLDWRLLDEEIDKIKNLIDNDESLTIEEKSKFLAGWDKGIAKETQDGGTKEGSTENNIGSEQELPTAEIPNGPSIGLAIKVSAEEQTLIDAVAEQEKKVIAAYSAFTKKAKSLDNQIQAETPDLFGDKKAPSSPLGFDEIDIAARDKAVKKEKNTLEKERTELSRLKAQLERVSGKPSAQVDLFENDQEEDVPPADEAPLRTFTALDLKLNPDVLESDPHSHTTSYPHSFVGLYTNQAALNGEGYENPPIGDIIHVFKKDYVVKGFMDNSEDPTKTKVSLIRVDKQGNLLRNSDVKKSERDDVEEEDIPEEDIPENDIPEGELSPAPIVEPIEKEKKPKKAKKIKQVDNKKDAKLFEDGFAGNEKYDALLPSDQMLIDELQAALARSKEYHNELATIWQVYVSSIVDAETLLDGKFPNGQKVTGKDRAGIISEIKSAIEYMNGYVPLMERERFNLPQHIEMLDNTVSEINDVRNLAVQKLQDKLDVIDKQITDLNIQRTSPEVKKDKKLKASIESEIEKLNYQKEIQRRIFNMEAEKELGIFHDFVTRRTVQEGLNLSKEELEELTSDILDLVYERPGVEWTWENKLDSVISYAIGLRLDGDQSVIDRESILHGDPSSEDIAEYLSLEKDDPNAALANTMLNYFKQGDIKSMVIAMGAAPQSVYQNVYKPLFDKLFDMSIPEDLTQMASRILLQNMLIKSRMDLGKENKIQQSNTTQNEQVQSGGSSTGTTGRKSGGRGSQLSKSDKGNAAEEVSKGDIGGDIGSISDQDRGPVQSTDAETDNGRADGTTSEGDRKTGSSSSSGPSNFRHRNAVKDTATTFNKIQKYKDNINALKMLVLLSEEGRIATIEEQTILSKYVGFGGLKEIKLNPKNQWEQKDLKYKEFVQEINDLIAKLDPTGAKKFLYSIKESTDNAHYTSGDIIRGMWHGVMKAGFTEGSILEPSAGIGNFITMLPDGIKLNHITAIEKDTLTGQILYHLLPKADVKVKGLEEAKLPHNAYDLVISNVPFGPYGVYDPQFEGRGQNYSVASGSIHNYFFAKAMDLVRPGGLVAFVTSRYTMDSTENRAARELISDMGQFMGAIRLPDTAFKANAGTEVVADIIFIRKYNEGEAKIEGQPFLNSNKHIIDEQEFNYNDYFVQHPEMIIGKLETTSSQFGPVLNVAGSPDINIEEEIKKASELIFPTRIYDQTQNKKNEKIKKQSNDYVTKKEYSKIGNIVELDNGEFGVVTNVIYKDEALDKKAWEIGINPDKIRDRQLTHTEEINLRSAGLSYDDFDIRLLTKIRISKEDKEKLPALINLRKLETELLYKELNGYGDFEIESIRKELRETYEAFVKKYGRLNDSKNSKALKHEVDQYVIMALEKLEKETKKFVPSDILTKRTINARTEISKADTLSDAILISFEEFGYINIPRVEQLLGKDIDKIIEDDVDKHLFKLPDGTYEDSITYLSGNVVEKLKEVEGNTLFARNESALKDVQPERIVASDIYSPMNARWIPIKVYSDFVKHIFGVDLGLKYSEALDQYTTQFNYTTPQLESYGTRHRTGKWILEHALKGIEPTVIRTDSETKKTYIDVEDTIRAKEQYAKMRKVFDDWKFKDDARRAFLENLYNDKFNQTVERKYDGSHLTMPGMLGITLLPHQKSAIWRFLQTGGGIMDHMVGAGKSLVMIGLAMEGKRLGKFKKPVMLGLKSQLPDFVKEFKRAYPLAKILFPSEKDFEPKNRKALLSKIATNDWDCVVLTHENFTGIRQDDDIQIELINELRDTILLEMDTVTDKKDISKLQTALRNYDKKIQQLRDVKKDTDLMSFTELGLDFMMLDESQEFKNLEFSTKQKNIRGLGNQKGSKRAFNLLVAIRSLQKMYSADKGILFASGTPISNTMAEMYLLMKYLRPSYLKQVGIASFDQWAGIYAESKTDLEFYFSKFKEVNRLRRFMNLPELLKAYREIADIRNSVNLVLPRPKGVHILEKIQAEPVQLKLIKKLEKFVSSRGRMHAQFLGLTNGYDSQKGFNPSAAIMAMTFAKKLSLDPRLVGTNAHGGKLVQAAKVIAESYNKYDEQKNVQLVFCDLGTPKTGNKIDDLYNYLEQEFDVQLTETDLKEIFGASYGVSDSRPSLKDIKNRMMTVDEDGHKIYLDINEQEFDQLVLESGKMQKFDAYNGLKQELLLKGIPAEQIAFIHDYPTRVKRQALFEKINNGDIRILVGSTKKMGVGVNVQKRISDLHHLDIPWKPSDLEQRNGRGERQGNDFAKDFQDDKVNIHYYATDRTMDATMYEIVSLKAKFIAQTKVTGNLSRHMEDIETDIDADAMAAELSGNPIYKIKSKLTKEVNELEGSRKAHRANVLRIKDSVLVSEKQIERNTAWLKRDLQLEKFIFDNNAEKYIPTKDEQAQIDKHLEKMVQKGEVPSPEVIEVVTKEVVGPNAYYLNNKLVKINAVIDGKEIHNGTEIGDALNKVFADNVMKRTYDHNGYTSSFAVGTWAGFNITGRMHSPYQDSKKSKADYRQLLLEITTPSGEVLTSNFNPSTTAANAGTQLKSLLIEPTKHAKVHERELVSYKKDLPIYQQQLSEVTDFPKQAELDRKEEELKEIERQIKIELANEKVDDEANIDDEAGGIFNLEEGPVEYARSSNGESVPFKIHGTGENPLGIPIHSEEDFSGVQREFAISKNIDLMGKTKINSIDDVAWLFRFLETEAVENSFAVYEMEDGSYVVHHMAIGTATAVMVDMQAQVAAATKLKAKKVYFIHNHPSGRLISSIPDRRVFGNMKKAFDGIAEVKAILINVASGQYATFDEYGDDGPSDFNNGDWDAKDLTPQNVYTFSKQYLVTGFTPKEISSSNDVAKILSTRRLGAGPKIELLVLNRGNMIVGKFSLPFTDITPENVNEIFKHISHTIIFNGGVSTIIYGNVELNQTGLNQLKDKLKYADIQVLDYIQVKSNLSTKSYMEEGYLHDPETPYKEALNEVHDSAKETDRFDKLNTLAFVSNTFKNLTKEEFLALHPQLSMFEKRDLRVAFEVMNGLKEKIKSNILDVDVINNIKEAYSFNARLVDAIDHYYKLLIFEHNKNKEQPAPKAPMAPVEDPITPEAPIPTPSSNPPIPPPPHNQNDAGDGYESEDDFLKQYDMPTSNIIGQMQSGKRLDEYVGDVDDDGYFVRELTDIGAAGDSMIQMAQEKFGYDVADYAPRLLSIIKKSTWNNDLKKITLTGRLIRSIQEEILSGNDSQQLKDIKKEAIKVFMSLGNTAALTLNAMKELYQVLAQGNFMTFYTKDMLNAKQQEAKKFYNTNEASMISDDIAETGSVSTPEDVKDAQEEDKKKKRPKKNDKKVEGDPSLYAKKAAEAASRINIDDIRNRTKNLEC